MIIEKIKAIKPEYMGSCGPAEVISLGIKSGDMSIIFGEFYLGPHMMESHGKLYDNMVKLIDHIVNCTKKYNQALERTPKTAPFS